MRELIPLFGIVFVIGPIATWAVSLTPIGRALAERIRGGGNRATDDITLELQDEIDRLHDHVASQDQRIEELHDRIDFTERLLTRGNPPREKSDVATPV